MLELTVMIMAVVGVRVRVRDSQGTKRLCTKRLGYEMYGSLSFLHRLFGIMHRSEHHQLSLTPVYLYTDEKICTVNHC